MSTVQNFDIECEEKSAYQVCRRHNTECSLYRNRPSRHRFHRGIFGEEQQNAVESKEDVGNGPQRKNEIRSIQRVSKLKLLGATFSDNPVVWDEHIHEILMKASSRLNILRVCKYYKYSTKQLDLLFRSLILSVFTYALEVKHTYILY